MRVNPTALVLWTIAIGGVARLAFGAAIGYGLGEGYYVASARHLALSYFDQPPLSLWIAWAAMKIAGAAATLVVRLPFIAMFGATTWLMYRLGETLFGAWAGAWAAVLLNLSPLFTISIGSWAQPDGPLFLFLLAATTAVAELCFGTPRRPLLIWSVTGAAFGLALLSKYHALLALAGLLIFVATTPDVRARMMNRGLLLAAAIAALIFMPVVIWNWWHDWISFLYQGERAGGNGFRPDQLARSLLGQAVFIGLFIWPPLVVVFLQNLRRGRSDVRAWFLCCLAAVPIVFFTALSLWAEIGRHFHWQAPGYVFLFPLLGRAVATRLEQGSVPTRRWIGLNAFLLAGLMVVIVTEARFGWVRAILPKALANTPAASSLTRGLLPWSGVRSALVARGAIPAARVFAVASHWAEAGKVDIEIGDLVPVVCLCEDARDFRFAWDDRTFTGWTAFIVDDDDEAHTRTRYGDHFSAIRLLTSVDVRLGGEVAKTIHLYEADNYDGRFGVISAPR